MIIRRVWKNKGNEQKLITIPSRSDIKEGDYVRIEKVGEKDENETQKSNK